MIFTTVLTYFVQNYFRLQIFGAMLQENFRIDDPIAAWPVHGTGGLWGILARGLFDLDDGLLVFTGS